MQILQQPLVPSRVDEHFRWSSSCLGLCGPGLRLHAPLEHRPVLATHRHHPFVVRREAHVHHVGGVPSVHPAQAEKAVSNMSHTHRGDMPACSTGSEPAQAMSYVKREPEARVAQTTYANLGDQHEAAYTRAFCCAHSVYMLHLRSVRTWLQRPPPHRDSSAAALARHHLQRVPPGVSRSKHLHFMRNTHREYSYTKIRTTRTDSVPE